MAKAYKILEVDGSKVKEKQELPAGLKGKVIVLNPEQSEIAKNLEIQEKGIYSLKAI